MLPLFISCTNTEVCVPSSLALDNWGQKYRHTLGNKPNPSIPIIFDRFTFKFLKNRPVTRQDKKYRKLKIDKFIFSLQKIVTPCAARTIGLRRENLNDLN